MTAAQVPAAPSQMAAEVREIPDAVERLLTGSAGAIRDAALAARALDPRVIATYRLSASSSSAPCRAHCCTIGSSWPAKLRKGLGARPARPAFQMIIRPGAKPHVPIKRVPACAGRFPART